MSRSSAQGKETKSGYVPPYCSRNLRKHTDLERVGKQLTRNLIMLIYDWRLYAEFPSFVLIVNYVLILASERDQRKDVMTGSSFIY
jgi:hypothetical protein